MGTATEIKKLSVQATKDGRTLQAEDVWEASRDKRRYPTLHQYVWGKTMEELAKERQLQLCHQLILSIRVLSPQGTPQRQFVHLRKQDKGYHPVERVTTITDLATAHLERLQSDIVRARVRLTGFREMLHDEIAGEIETAMEAAEQAVRAAIQQRRMQGGSEAEAAS